MKEKITYITIGILLAVIALLGYLLFSMSKVVSSDHAMLGSDHVVLGQIVSLINSNQPKTAK